MKKLIALLGFLVFPAMAATYDFENIPQGSFKKLVLPGMTIETGFDDVSFIGDEIGRPNHFGVNSLYSSGTITMTFNPMVKGVAMSGAPYPIGRVQLLCWLWDNQQNKPYPYPMSDTTFEDAVYPQFDNVSANPPARFRVTKCTVKGLDQGIWIDAIGTAQ